MTEATAPQKQFSIQKLYIKDLSYESPGSPKIFGFKQWDPKVEMNLTNTHTQVEGDIYEAVLRITVTATHEEKPAFLSEVQYAGLFAIAGFEEEERNYLVGSQCMNILFPYAREVISELSLRGGFPPLLLQPVNFDLLYQQHLQQKQAQQDEPEATH